MPKKGLIANVGLKLLSSDGRGLIEIPPVSVCHHVSAILHLPKNTP